MIWFVYLTNFLIYVVYIEMEYKIQKWSNGKRKTEEEQTHNNSLKSQKTYGVACIEVLSKDYFHVYMKELEEILNSGFTNNSLSLTIFF